MAICEVCKNNIKFLDAEIILSYGATRIHICSKCKQDVLDNIDHIKGLPTLTQKIKAIENLPSKYNAYVRGVISREIIKSPDTTVRKCKLYVRGGRKEIGMNTMMGANVVFCVTTDGYVYFEHKPDVLYVPVSYNWGGPLYSEVTHTTGKSKEKVNEKTKRKGGLGGAIVGNAILPGAGALIGYGMTSKNVTKGKNVTNNNGRTYTSNVEVSSSGNMQLRRSDGLLISLEFANDNQTNAFMLSVEWGKDPGQEEHLEEVQRNIESDEYTIKPEPRLEEFPDVEIIMPEKDDNRQNADSSTEESSSPFMDNEMEKIKILKEYKALLDDGIITQEEFDAKKKEIM